MKNVIVIVDDREDDRLLLDRTLRKLEVTNPILHLEDGDEAIAYLRGEGRFSDRTIYPFPSMLFLDLKMPRMSGYQVLDWIQRQQMKDGLLVIVLSDLHATEVISRAYHLGADSFLIKPAKEEDLHEFILSFPSYWNLANRGVEVMTAERKAVAMEASER
ncbi:MAG: putative response regulator, CheY [Verrucomicrobiales bacterium]|nr:putative response regulator, CheY [Verrucomicrobiales bacterium]